MAIRYINRNALTNIADAIREKKELPSTQKLRLEEFAPTLESGVFNWKGKENKVLAVYYGESSYPWHWSDDDREDYAFDDSRSNTEFNNLPYCGYNIVNMASAYYDCYTMVGDPMCGNNVINMEQAFYNCQNLVGSPVCGPNVVDFEETYYNCYNLTGAPVCGLKVVNMVNAYRNCQNLIGSPVCGPNVVNMIGAFYNCYNLTGSPVCGPNVTRFDSAYYNCYNLTGSPVCGPNVTRFDYAYRNCYNLDGYIVNPTGSVPMEAAYDNCRKLKGSPNPSNHSYMVSVYRNCRNLTGEPIIASGCYTANAMYFGCIGLTGDPKGYTRYSGYGKSRLGSDSGNFSDQVREGTYGRCHKLRGTMNISAYYGLIRYAFYECYNLGGLYIQSNETLLNNSKMKGFVDRSNNFASELLTPTYDAPDTPGSLGYNEQEISEISYGYEHPSRLNIVFNNRQLFTNVVKNADVFGCSLSTATSKSTIVNLPHYSASNQLVKNDTYYSVRECNNARYNIYVYCTE